MNKYERETVPLTVHERKQVGSITELDGSEIRNY